jgi:hypothetical protein
MASTNLATPLLSTQPTDWISAIQSRSNESMKYPTSVYAATLV